MESKDGDEMQLSWEELHKMVQEEVQNNQLMLQKKNQLTQMQMHIERRETLAKATRKIYDDTCKSVEECETIVKELYSHLGIEYRDTDSENEELDRLHSVSAKSSSKGPTRSNLNDADDDDTMDCDDTVQSASESTQKDPPTNGPNTQSERVEFNTQSLLVTQKQPVVVLTRLPKSKLPGDRTSKRPRYNSEEEDEDPVACGSDTQWEPPDEASNNSSTSDSGSDPSYSDSEPHSKKGFRRKKIQKPCQFSKAKRRKTSVSQVETNPGTSDQVTASTQTQENSSAKTNPTTAESIKVSTMSQAPTNPASQSAPALAPEEVKVDMPVLAKTKSKTWQKGKVAEVVAEEDEVKFLIDFEEKGKRLLPGHHIAFSRTPTLDRLFVGARVVARYQNGDQPKFQVGVLAELPNRKNRMRFLVFFDDHTPCYVGLPLLHLVCRPLNDICDDIDDLAHKDFIKDYLRVWPNPPQAQYKVGQSLNVEHNGVQKKCEVEQVDGSLVHVTFMEDDHKEWVYRGSMRLEHMRYMKQRFKEMEQFGKKNTVTTQSQISNPVSTSSAPAANQSAAKSIIPGCTSKKLDSKQPPGKACDLSVVSYTPHRCCPACVDRVRPKANAASHRSCNPILLPLQYGFYRVKAPRRGSGKGSPRSSNLFYRSPCGVCLRTMANVQDYLQQVRCDFLQLDMFCLDPHVSATTTYSFLPSKIFIPDLSQGREAKQVACVNEHNNIRPAMVIYTQSRKVTSDISINTSLNFMVGCDCTDGCADSVACSCHQLTVQATAQCPGGPLDVNAGYSHKRLGAPLVTGLYECNAQCRCDPRMCSNRVVQNGIQLRLQIFMTQGKGWGVRCLDDLARGTFVCTYSGKVVRADKKNTQSNAYYVKLNHIEAVENHKEDYESDVNISDSEPDSMQGEDNGFDNNYNNGNKEEDDVWSHSEDEKSDDSSDSNSDPYKAKKINVLKKHYITRTNTKTQRRDKEQTAEDEAIHSTDSALENEKETAQSVTTRSFFGKGENSYIIDSKTEGNVARYLNHSCSPNLFGQNVFVDTHDLRFPWVAFFTKKRIKAGTELTWNYRSVFGSAKDVSRSLVCRCGSENCLGKL